MSRSDFFKIAWVLVILAPLIIVQAGVGYSPDWLDQRIAGVPLTVCATGIWFVVMMVLAWRFAAGATAKAKAAAKEVL
ncbi:MAG: hypothetical protein JWM78_675 [Verrucomicrobiaceae bacterium]|nr:hypothetical protein [Verrucomicrobiaceae bacterium]